MIKIKYLNTLNYSIIKEGIENVRYKYANALVQSGIYNHQSYIKDLTSLDQLTKLANGKKQLSDIDTKYLLPTLNIDKQSVENNLLVDGYQTKQYVRIKTIKHLCSQINSPDKFERLRQQILASDLGTNIGKYLKKTLSKQVVYVRANKLIIILLQQFMVKNNVQFTINDLDETAVQEIIKTMINSSFNYLPVSTPELINKQAHQYSNSYADKIKKELNHGSNVNFTIVKAVWKNINPFDTFKL